MTSRGIAIPPPEAFAIDQHDPEFSPLVATILGQEMTDKDGWDKDLSALAALFDGGDDLLKAMAGHILDSDFVDGDIDTGLFQPLASGAASLISDGQTIFDDMVSNIDPNAPPTPPAGGGGGGGGGNTGPCPPGTIRWPGGACVPIVGGGGGPHQNPPA